MKIDEAFAKRLQEIEAAFRTAATVQVLCPKCGYEHDAKIVRYEWEPMSAHPGMRVHIEYQPFRRNTSGPGFLIEPEFCQRFTEIICP